MRTDEKSKPASRRKGKRKRNSAPFVRLADDARLVLHRPTGRADVAVRLPDGRWIKRSCGLAYLGADGQVCELAIKRGHERAREARALGGADSRPTSALTVRAAGASYLAWVTEQRSASELAHVRVLLANVCELYGDTLARDFDGPALLEWRDAAVRSGAWSRWTLSSYTSRLRKMFSWLRARKLAGVTAEQTVELDSVESLPSGIGRPKRRVEGVSEEVFFATLERLSGPVRALLELQWHTGARMGELVRLRPCDVQRNPGGLWIVVLEEHKTAHHTGEPRRFRIGPDGQRVLEPWLRRPAGAYCFTPREAMQEYLAGRTARRVVPAGVGHEADDEARARALAAVGDRYDTNAVRIAIARACRRKGLPVLPTWTPHMVRHSWTQRMRDAGIAPEALAAQLGHVDVEMVKTYSRLRGDAADEVMRKLG